MVTPPTADRAELKKSVGAVVASVARWRAAGASAAGVEGVVAARRALGQLVARMLRERFREAWEANGRPAAV